MRSRYMIDCLCCTAERRENATHAVLELANGNLDEEGYGAFLRVNAKRQKR